jgi:DNA-binding CsgD family transcriptional regulator
VTLAGTVPSKGGSGVDADTARSQASYGQLTPRQREVLRLLVQGASRAEIARRLGERVRGVDSDLAAIYRAFDLEQSGLTPAQRRLELRRILGLLRKREQQGGAIPPPPVTPSAEPPPEPARSPLVFVPPTAPVAAPPVTTSPWRWWPLAAILLALTLAGGVWWSRHPARPTALASPTATSTPTPTSVPILAAPTTAPTMAPPSTVTPRPPAPSPTPRTGRRSPAIATVHPAATPLDLAGKVASRRPGTPLRLGQPVASIIDRQAKPYDVYALPLKAGRTLHVQVTASSDAFGVILAAADAPDLLGTPGIPFGPFLCNFTNPCVKDFAIAADGTYTLVVGSNEGSGVRYTLEATVR